MVFCSFSDLHCLKLPLKVTYMPRYPNFQLLISVCSFENQLQFSSFINIIKLSTSMKWLPSDQWAVRLKGSPHIPPPRRGPCTCAKTNLPGCSSVRRLDVRAGYIVDCDNVACYVFGISKWQCRHFRREELIWKVMWLVENTQRHRFWWYQERCEWTCQNIRSWACVSRSAHENKDKIVWIWICSWTHFRPQNRIQSGFLQPSCW